MEIRKEINDFYALADMVWSGAVDTIADIQNANKEDEFMNFLEMVFCDEVPTDTAVNDFIWFERDYIYENIGLTENGELPEEEMIEALNESIKKLELEDDFEEFCDDCEECICDRICYAKGDCETLFEDYKNQIVTIDEIKETWEEKTGMNIWR
ncbi:MAG: hypothetical protein ACOCM4_08825 [Acetivibrio ethanolgignens]